MERRPLKTRAQRWPMAVARLLLKCHLTPNQVSVLSVVTSLGAAWALAWQSHAWWGLLLAATGIQLRLMCNLLDGLMAVEGGAKSRTGELYNEIPDRLADGLLLTATGYAVGLPWLGWLATALALLTAYVRALGGSLGCGQDFCGPGAKPHRMFVLTVGCLGQMICVLLGNPTPLLAYLLWVVVGLTAITAVRRTLRLAQRCNCLNVSL